MIQTSTNLNNLSLSKPRKRRSESSAQQRLNSMEAQHPQTGWLRVEYAQGRSTYSLAREAGVSKSFIRQALLRAGITLRPSCRIGGKHTPMSRRLMGQLERGPRNCRWRGGQRRHAQGYVRILSPDHPSSDCDGYIRRSRFVLEEIIGRTLKRGEIVHHLNGQTDDDRPENLQLFPNSADHLRFHRVLNRIQKVSSPAFRGESPVEWDSRGSASAEKGRE